MKLVLLLLAWVFVLGTSADRGFRNFENFRNIFSKLYSNQAQQIKRMNLYLKNADLVNSLNSNFLRIRRPFRLKVNKFSDFTLDEVIGLYTGYRTAGNNIQSDVKNISITTANVPASFDWRTKNAVTPVKYQGPCGSCWAFAAVAILESYYAIKNNKLLDLSEQQLVDCSSTRVYGNYGCNGGLTYKALAYTQKMGIMREADYPYTGEMRTCRYSPSKVVLKSGNFYRVTGEDKLKAIVATYGPVAVSIYISYNFVHYDSGILDDPDCKKGNTPNHAVVVVGYGTENNIDYWLIKNSWGVNWGEKGFVRLLRNKNMCNILYNPVYAIV